MKKLVTAITSALILFSINAQTATTQNNNSPAPANTVLLFLNYMAKADFTNAKNFVAAKELQQMISGLDELCKEMPELKADSVAEFAPLAKAKIISEKISEDKATVKISYKENGKDTTDTFELKKISGRWMIVQ